MDFFWSLFSLQPKCRQYALLDSTGVCRAFKECTQPPADHNWVEINEIRLSWMHQPLPASARISPRAALSSMRQLLVI